MIDLHMHTNLSDGALSRDELLLALKERGIRYFSITDHNHALAFEKMPPIDFAKGIVGAEIATSFEGHIVEVLLYDGDAEVINDWYRSFYSQENLKKIEETLFEDLKRIAKKQQYQLPESLVLDKIEKGYAKKKVFKALKENNPRFPFERYKSFFREGLSNPESEFFLNEARTYPTIEEVLALAHQSRSYAVLAHPYEYGLPIEDLKNWVLDHGIDGMESFHPSASPYQSVGIVEFCENHGLISSIGSDYHRDARKIPLGVHVHPHVLESSCFDWIWNR